MSVCMHPPARTIHLDTDTNECLACGDTWGGCEHDNGVEWVGDDDGPIYACVMCGEQLECP
jgi:hypothetical protein